MTTLRTAVDAFLAKVDTGWQIHPSHLEPLRNASSDAELRQETEKFLAKVEQGWAIHPSHLEPMRKAIAA